MQQVSQRLPDSALVLRWREEDHKATASCAEQLAPYRARVACGLVDTVYLGCRYAAGQAALQLPALVQQPSEV